MPPDDMDRVQERVDLHTQRAIAAQRPPATPGLLLCEECEAEIPERRREAYPAARCCVPCQRKREAARGR